MAGSFAAGGTGSDLTVARTDAVLSGRAVRWHSRRTSHGDAELPPIGFVLTPDRARPLTKKLDG